MNVLLTLPMTIVESARAPSALPLPPAHTRRPSRTTASVACSAPATLRAASSAAGKRNASSDPSETIAAAAGSPRGGARRVSGETGASDSWGTRRTRRARHAAPRGTRDPVRRVGRGGDLLVGIA